MQLSCFPPEPRTVSPSVRQHTWFHALEFKQLLPPLLKHCVLQVASPYFNFSLSVLSSFLSHTRDFFANTTTSLAHLWQAGFFSQLPPWLLETTEDRGRSLLCKLRSAAHTITNFLVCQCVSLAASSYNIGGWVWGIKPSFSHSLLCTLPAVYSTHGKLGFEPVATEQAGGCVSNWASCRCSLPATVNRALPE